MLTLPSGVDFDDPEYGVKEEDKDSHKVNSAHMNDWVRLLIVLTKTHRLSMRTYSAGLLKAAMGSVELWKRLSPNSIRLVSKTSRVCHLSKVCFG